jgi:hypothetical protein
MKQPDKIILKFMIHKKGPSYLGELPYCPSMGLWGEEILRCSRVFHSFKYLRLLFELNSSSIINNSEAQ